MKTVNRIAALLMIGFIIFILIKRHVFEDNKLAIEHKLTVATVYEIVYPVDGGPDAKFEYCVNQIKYKGYKMINTIKPQKVSVGTKFLLEYYPPDPKIARIQLDKPLDSLLISKLSLNLCKEK